VISSSLIIKEIKKLLNVIGTSAISLGRKISKILTIISISLTKITFKSLRSEVLETVMYSITSLRLTKGYTRALRVVLISISSLKKTISKILKVLSYPIPNISRALFLGRFLQVIVVISTSLKKALSQNLIVLSSFIVNLVVTPTRKIRLVIKEVSVITIKIITFVIRGILRVKVPRDILRIKNLIGRIKNILEKQ
jgi:hypothetical protein